MGGVVWGIVFLMLAFPLVLVLALGGPPVERTIQIYVVAMILDVIVFSAAAYVVVRAAIQASRGELFMLPLVTALGDRLFGRRGV